LQKMRRVETKMIQKEVMGILSEAVLNAPHLNQKLRDMWVETGVLQNALKEVFPRWWHQIQRSFMEEPKILWKIKNKNYIPSNTDLEKSLSEFEILKSNAITKRLLLDYYQEGITFDDKIISIIENLAAVLIITDDRPKRKLFLHKGFREYCKRPTIRFKVIPKWPMTPRLQAKSAFLAFKEVHDLTKVQLDAKEFCEEASEGGGTYPAVSRLELYLPVFDQELIDLVKKDLNQAGIEAELDRMNAIKIIKDEIVGFINETEKIIDKATGNNISNYPINPIPNEKRKTSAQKKSLKQIAMEKLKAKGIKPTSKRTAVVANSPAPQPPSPPPLTIQPPASPPPNPPTPPQVAPTSVEILEAREDVLEGVMDSVNLELKETRKKKRHITPPESREVPLPPVLTPQEQTEVDLRRETADLVGEAAAQEKLEEVNITPQEEETIEQITQAATQRLVSNPKPINKTIVIHKGDYNKQLSEWVRDQAQGVCECCEAEITDLDDNDKFLLTAHALTRISRGGKYEAWNLIALCPLCIARVRRSKHRETWKKSCKAIALRKRGGQHIEF